MEKTSVNPKICRPVLIGNVPRKRLYQKAVEHTLKNKVTYDNPELPLGPGTKEEQEVIAVHVMLSRRW
jgi:hypothetical protein